MFAETTIPGIWLRTNIIRKKGEGKMEEKIIEALNQIRPLLQRDGGDVEFVSFDENEGIVKVRLRGACAGCAGAQMTLKMVVERILKESVPGVKGIVNV